MWRLYSHSNISRGASPYVLLNIFRTWILPLFDYGSCIWIFLIFDGDVQLDKKPSRGYIKVFNKLDTLYMRCCKLILGVPTSSRNISVLVRLGFLPLRFHFVWRALVWYLKAYHGRASRVVQRQLFEFFEDDEIWFQSSFYNPAYRMLLFLRRVSCINFWGIPVDKVSEPIRDALFKVANNFWSNLDISPHVRVIHPIWQFKKFSRICHSRHTNAIFHSCALGRGRLQEFLFSCGTAPHPNCCLGCADRENTYHVFISCPQRKEKRNFLKKKFDDLSIAFNLTNLFTNEKIQIDVEKFIKEIF